MCSPKMSCGMLFLSNKSGGPNDTQKAGYNGPLLLSNPYHRLPKIPIIIKLKFKKHCPLPSLLHQIKLK